MKPLVLLFALLYCWSPLLAQEEEEGGAEGCGEGEPPAAAQPEGPAPEPAKVLTELTMANAIKDVSKIDMICKDVIAVAKTSKDEAILDAMVKELATALKVCKGNWGTLGRVVDALGEMRTKDGAKVLKKLAGEKSPEEGEEEGLTSKAIVALALMADTKNLKVLEDQMKNRSVKVAKAAYEAMKHYAGVRGRDRKKITENLMKRIEAENPEGNSKASAEATARWQELQPVIIASLQAICRQPTINDVANWREWWREKKKDAKEWKDD